MLMSIKLKLIKMLLHYTTPISIGYLQYSVLQCKNRSGDAMVYWVDLETEDQKHYLNSRSSRGV